MRIGQARFDLDAKNTNEDDGCGEGHEDGELSLMVAHTRWV